jgi:hypothetical protein
MSVDDKTRGENLAAKSFKGLLKKVVYQEFLRGYQELVCGFIWGYQELV